MSNKLRQQLDEAKRTIVLLEEDNKALSGYVESAKNAEQLQAELDELTKKLTASESAKESYRKSSNAHSEELEAIHEVLDALPASIPRRAEGSYRDRSVLTRLAAWLGSTK